MRDKIQPLKRLGQNFLVDANIQNRLVESLSLTKDTLVIEVGPGRGAITVPIAAKAAKVLAIEIDRGLSTLLAEKFFGTNISIIHQDALQSDFFALATEGNHKRRIFVANLPYYIATQIVVRAASSMAFSELFFMSQKELADRYMAIPGSKTYGAVSVFLQLMGRMEVLFDVPRNAFDPVPEVESVFVRFELNVSITFEPSSVSGFVRSCFASRRKTIRNNLLARFDRETTDSCLTATGLAGTARAETFSPPDFLKLYAAFKSKQHDV